MRSFTADNKEVVLTRKLKDGSGSPGREGESSLESDKVGVRGGEDDDDSDDRYGEFDDDECESEGEGGGEEDGLLEEKELEEIDKEVIQSE